MKLALLRIWWHEMILGHYMGKLPTVIYLDCYDHTCKKRWKVRR